MFWNLLKRIMLSGRILNECLGYDEPNNFLRPKVPESVAIHCFDAQKINVCLSASDKNPIAKWLVPILFSRAIYDYIKYNL